MRALSALRSRLRSCYAIECEIAIVALVLITWELGRLPLEGSPDVSVRHAQAWLRLENTLGLNVERPFIDVGSTQPWQGLLNWSYGAIHTPATFAFVAVACLLAPDRYPRLRTIFILSFIPAFVVIGLYPLAPPHWLPELGLGPTPTQYELTGTVAGIFQNSTAAAASQHFGFAAFIAAGSIWLFPRSSFAWATLAYPAFVFVVIVGTGNHYVLDCVVGVLTFALATAVAFLIHRGGPVARRAPALPRREIAVVATGYAMLAVGVDSLASLWSGDWTPSLLELVVLVVGIGAVLSPRMVGRPAAAEA